MLRPICTEASSYVFSYYPHEQCENQRLAPKNKASEWAFPATEVRSLCFLNCLICLIFLLSWISSSFPLLWENQHRFFSKANKCFQYRIPCTCFIDFLHSYKKKSTAGLDAHKPTYVFLEGTISVHTDFRLFLILLDKDRTSQGNRGAIQEPVQRACGSSAASLIWGRKDRGWEQPCLCRRGLAGPGSPCCCDSALSYSRPASFFQKNAHQQCMCSRSGNAYTR